MISSFFKIAGNVLSVKAEYDVSSYLPSFAPFCVQSEDIDILVVIRNDNIEPKRISKIKSYDWFESVATLYTTDGGFLWERVDVKNGSCSSIWWNGFAPKEFFVNMEDEKRTHVFEHLLFVAFNYGSLSSGILILHSSVVVKDGFGYMFLGESGTGKSTHCRLWLDNIEGSEMLNDDAPAVRVCGDNAVVYGSPWSGKGACYRNMSAPIKGIYRLSQAPYNKLHKVNNIQALSAILPSCLPSFMEREEHLDLVCVVISDIISHTSHFSLECLPNAQAARISYNQ